MCEIVGYHGDVINIYIYIILDVICVYSRYVYI